MRKPDVLRDASGCFTDELKVAHNGILQEPVGLELLSIPVCAVVNRTLGETHHVPRIEAPITFETAFRG